MKNNPEFLKKPEQVTEQRANRIEQTLEQSNLFTKEQIETVSRRILNTGGDDFPGMIQAVEMIRKLSKKELELLRGLYRHNSLHDAYDMK